jgi:glycolate oxidase FAD binding subunit
LPAAADQNAVRRAAIEAGGHAMLVRASEELRRRIPALHPQAPGVAALSARVKAAFDPAGILSRDRFGDAHAH